MYVLSYISLHDLPMSYINIDVIFKIYIKLQLPCYHIFNKLV